ncbi:MAG: hypothetical protein EZS28_038794 [Streblomastix strix]|uniref:Reverse transcriptase domain-containing protein n=1 Tax=Streblomastix strix TaxID=222440 RepID=A0A5J4U5M4_9EUKA|nr:MAG: hypothetical protein EZS28_038794 [Streblomastix strix]
MDGVQQIKSLIAQKDFATSLDLHQAFHHIRVSTEFKPQFNQVRKQPKKLQRRISPPKVVPQTVNNKPYQPIQPQKPKIIMNIQPKQSIQIRNPQIAFNNPPIQPLAANQDNQEPFRETTTGRVQGGYVMPLDILSQVKLKKAGQQPPIPGTLKATPNTQQVKAKDDPRFKANFYRLNQKMPIRLIAMQMRNNGLDPEVLNRPDDVIPPDYQEEEQNSHPSKSNHKFWVLYNPIHYNKSPLFIGIQQDLKWVGSDKTQNKSVNTTFKWPLPIPLLQIYNLKTTCKQNNHQPLSKPHKRNRMPFYLSRRAYQTRLHILLKRYTKSNKLYLQSSQQNSTTTRKSLIWIQQVNVQRNANQKRLMIVYDQHWVWRRIKKVQSKEQVMRTLNSKQKYANQRLKDKELQQLQLQAQRLETLNQQRNGCQYHTTMIESLLAKHSRDESKLLFPTFFKGHQGPNVGVSEVLGQKSKDKLKEQAKTAKLIQLPKESQTTAPKSIQQSQSSIQQIPTLPQTQKYQQSIIQILPLPQPFSYQSSTLPSHSQSYNNNSNNFRQWSRGRGGPFKRDRQGSISPYLNYYNSQLQQQIQFSNQQQNQFQSQFASLLPNQPTSSNAPAAPQAKHE